MSLDKIVRTRALVFLIAMLLGGCAAMRGSRGSGIMAMGPETDLNLRRCSGLGLVDAPQLRDYLVRVLAGLEAEVPDYERGKVPVYVRATDRWGAESTADSAIYINLGLIRRLGSEDEIAFVLGHELAHIVRRHTNSDAVRDAQERALKYTSLAMALGDQLQKEVGVGGSVSASGAQELQQAALMANVSVVSPAWNRDQEREADELGLQWMLAAGYSPAGAEAVLEKMAEAEKADADAELRALLEGIEFSNSSDGYTPDAIGKRIGLFLNDARGWLMRRGGRSHPTAVSRMKDVAAYLEQHRADASRPSLRTAAWFAEMRSSETRAVLSHYDSAADAWSLASDGKLPMAERLGLVSISGITSGHPYTRFHMSLIRERQGKMGASLQNLERAFHGPEPALGIFDRAATIHQQNGEPERAADVMREAAAKLNYCPALMARLIEVYVRADRVADAEAAVKECKTKYARLADYCGKVDPRLAAAKPETKADGSSDNARRRSVKDFLSKDAIVGGFKKIPGPPGR